MKFKKGSAAAKAYMAKIRAKRGKPKKIGKKAAPKKTARKKYIKKAIPKKVASHKDTKSHNVNIKVVSGLSKSKKLKNALKKDGLKLPHGYSLAKRKIGSLTTDRIKQSLELITTFQDNLNTWIKQTGKGFESKDYKATRAKSIKYYRASLKEEKIHLKELKKLI